MVDNPLYVAGGVIAYLFAGFPVSMLKWYNKVRAVKTAISIARRDFVVKVNAGKITSIAKPSAQWNSDQPIKKEWVNAFNGYVETHVSVRDACSHHNVKLTINSNGGLGPNQDGSPIKTWWFFWPFALIGVVYVPIENFCGAMYERTHGAYK